MKVSIAREYGWEMGHALMNHRGKCFRPHGHNYRMEVEVSGLLDDSTSMILDFADLDSLVKPRIEELDHRFLVHIDDARFGDDYAFLDCHFGVQYIKWDEDPTAESIVLHIFSCLVADMRDTPELILERVTLYETDKASATVRST
tara:strand:+ start:1881 stop:2315 length:435 start_codon:yes stop_codon:yes gene_type:complete